MKLLRKFDKKITTSKLFLYWFCFLFIGILIMLVVTPLHPSFIESEREIVANFCEPLNILFVAMAFVIETILFMVLPWKIFGLKGAKIGLIIWSLLHLMGGNLPIFLYISVMALFYYRCLEIDRWKSLFLFHFIINIPGLLSCL